MTGAQDPPAIAAAALSVDATEMQACQALEAAGGDPGDPLQLALVFSDLAQRREAPRPFLRPPEPVHVLQAVYEATAWPTRYLAEVLGWKKVTVQTYTSGRIHKPLKASELSALSEALADQAAEINEARDIVAAEIERTAG